MGRLSLRALVRACAAFTFLAFLNSFCAFAQAPNPFFTPPTYAGGSGQAFSADLNGDGKIDLIFTDGTVLLGKGDGTFTTGTPWRSQGAPQIALADFNGDGKLDILFIGTLNQLLVSLGNGDGTFQAPITTSIAAPPTSFVVGDLNGDGKPDVLAQVGSMFFTYLGKGDGTFQAGIASNAVDASASDAFADFNGDGKLDLFVFGQGIQLGNGDGTFQAVTPFSSAIPGGGGVLGDFNGDGKLDVVISGSPSGSPELQVLFGNGDGTFNPGPVFPLPANASLGDLTVADMNGDGKDDLIGFTVNAVQVLIGKGDGTFVAGKFYSIPQGTTLAVAIADFNGDHKKDIAACNTMLLGNGDGSLQGDEAVPAIEAYSEGASGASGDFNGDGHPDIALIASTSTSSNSVLEIWLNDGKSNFTLAHTYQIPIPVPGNFGGAVVVYSAADINGDGKIDLEAVLGDATGLTVLTLLGNGDGSFGAPISSRINNDMNGGIVGFALGDVNGDGKPDVLVNTVGRAGCCAAFDVLLNNGDGSFGAPTSPFVGAPQGTLVVGDFNNDKKLDVVMGTSSGIAVALGNGDGTFQPTTFNTSAACQAACMNPLVGDFNGDGNLDLFFQVTGGYQVLLGKGDGTFTNSPQVSAGPLYFYQGTGTVVDINGDGHPDIVGSTGSGLALTLGNGDGTFGPVFSLPALISISGSSTGTPLVGDFNGDGKLDIALLTPVQLVWLFNNGATGTGTGTGAPPPPPDFSVGSSSGGGTATVTAGSTATYPVSLAGSGGFTGTVALTCSVAPAGPGCSVSPSSVSVSGGTAAKATVSVTTTARSELIPIGVPIDPHSSLRLLWIFAAFLAASGAFPLFANTRLRPRCLSWSSAMACGSILLLSVSLISGCGQGSNSSSSGSGGSTPTGTTAGNYTVTVSAQSGSVVHKTQLTLTVK